MLITRLGISEVVMGGTETTAHVETSPALFEKLRETGDPVLLKHADALERSRGLIVLGLVDIRKRGTDSELPDSGKIGLSGPLRFLRGKLYAEEHGGEIPHIGNIAKFTLNQHRLAKGFAPSSPSPVEGAANAAAHKGGL